VFQYFDLPLIGEMDLGQFTAALEKFGCTFSRKEILALFNKFDRDHIGKM